MGKFEEDFRMPVSFSDGTLVVSGYISKEDASIAFSQYTGEHIFIDDIESDFIRFGFAPDYVEDGNGEAMWYTGAGNTRGSKPVWVYGN